MGPLLFSIFINDSPYVVKNANVVMSCASPTLVELRENLYIELDSSTKWVRMNKLELNIVKTNATAL